MTNDHHRAYSVCCDFLLLKDMIDRADEIYMLRLGIGEHALKIFITAGLHQSGEKGIGNCSKNCK